MRKPWLTAYEEFSSQDRCPECREKLVDAGEEVACPSCGLVLGTNATSRITQASGLKLEVLGSYVGRTDARGEHASQVGYVFGVTRLRANTIGRDPAFLQCSRLIERVSARFALPKTVAQNALQTAKRLLPRRKAYRVTVPAISAYSLLHACRSAEVSRVGFDDLLTAYSETGHTVSKSQMLRIGRESPLPLPAVRPEGLVRRAVAKLQSDSGIVDRIKKANRDERRYFTDLLEVARTIVANAGYLGGYSPRTLAAGSVYLAGRRLGPKVIRQREAAESLGIAEYTIREFCSRYRNQEAR